MSELDQAIQKMASLEAAIEDALRNEGAEAVKEAIVASGDRYVYSTYQPQFNRRRGMGNTGGILDKNSIKVEVHGNELTARDNADWQQLFGGKKPNASLADAIATGNPRFHMEKAGPRPFHEHAKRAVIESGILESALRRGLVRQGYDVSGLTFTFT